MIIDTFRGVFDRDSTQTLYLFVDVKTDGPTTWPAVVNALQPLRSKGWLTKVNGTTVTKGPITVVGTGLKLHYSAEFERKHTVESISRQHNQGRVFRWSSRSSKFDIYTQSIPNRLWRL